MGVDLGVLVLRLSLLQGLESEGNVSHVAAALRDIHCPTFTFRTVTAQQELH